MPQARDCTAWLTIALALLGITALCPAAWAQQITTIRANGDSANRVDLVILGDGYTASELGQYANNVETFVDGLFGQTPFAEYRRYFNVHRIDVVSAESGADHPERTPPVLRDTALDAAYNCAGIQRLICVSMDKVNTVLTSVPANMRDGVLVIVNDPEYGGAGGAIAVASINAAVVELILHELGHSFGLLADEYGGPPPPSCDATVEPPEANATREMQRALIKWNVWIEPSTPIPTRGPTVGLPGLYEGAKYCDKGLFRPTYDSKMRTLSRSFEQINSEQLVKRVYNWASPIDASEPGASAVILSQKKKRTFTVRTPRPLTHALDIVWYVDGQAAGAGSAFTLRGRGLTPGSHTVEVVVSDPTPLVRNDPQNVLMETQTWNVTVKRAKGRFVRDDRDDRHEEERRDRHEEKRGR
jgi:hypothetical protein